MTTINIRHIYEQPAVIVAYLRVSGRALQDNTRVYKCLVTSRINPPGCKPAENLLNHQFEDVWVVPELIGLVRHIHGDFEAMDCSNTTPGLYKLHSQLATLMLYPFMTITWSSTTQSAFFVSICTGLLRHASLVETDPGKAD